VQKRDRNEWKGEFEVEKCSPTGMGGGKNPTLGERGRTGRRERGKGFDQIRVRRPTISWEGKGPAEACRISGIGESTPKRESRKR